MQQKILSETLCHEQDGANNLVITLLEKLNLSCLRHICQEISIVLNV